MHERFTRTCGYTIAELDSDSVPWIKSGIFATADDAYVAINARHRHEAQQGELEPTRYIVLEVRRN